MFASCCYPPLPSQPLLMWRSFFLLPPGCRARQKFFDFSATFTRLAAFYEMNPMGTLVPRRLYVVHVLGATFLSLFATSRLACAQEPRKIVEQYVKAAGGSRALSKIQALAIEGTFTTDDDKSGTYTLDTKLPNRYYLELLVGDQNLIEAYNGKSAWCRDSAGEFG